jgi:hypothetical protein
MKDLLEEVIENSDDPKRAREIAEEEAAIIDAEIAEYDTRKMVIRFFNLDIRLKLDIVNGLGLWETGDAHLNMIDLDKTHLKRAVERGLLEKVWEMMPEEKKEERPVHNLIAEGLHIQVSRNETTGILVVDICTHDLEDRDQHLDTAVPNIRIMVNEAPIRFDPDGNIIEEYEE